MLRRMSESEQTIRRYLLGELSEAERSALEEKYFTDSQFFEQVLKTESELVDTYVRNQLSNEARERFEHSYMAHPSRSERVQFAAALATRLESLDGAVTGAEQQHRQPPLLPVPWWQRLRASFRGRRQTLRLSIAFATLLIMLGGVWILIESRRRQRESAQTRAAYEAEQRRQREQSQQAPNQDGRVEESTAKQESIEPNPSPLPQPTPGANPNLAPRSVSLALSLGGVRGSDTSQIPTLVIRPDTTQAQLRLNLRGDDYPIYSASLQTIEGAEIFSQTRIRPRRGSAGPIFVFTVPARKLASGDYVLTLRGEGPNGEIDALGKSIFRVEKR